MSVLVHLRFFYVTRKHERPHRGTETDVTQDLNGRHIWLHSKHILHSCQLITYIKMTIVKCCVIRGIQIKV